MPLKRHGVHPRRGAAQQGAYLPAASSSPSPPARSQLRAESKGCGVAWGWPCCSVVPLAHPRWGGKFSPKVNSHTLAQQIDSGQDVNEVVWRAPVYGKGDRAGPQVAAVTSSPMLPHTEGANAAPGGKRLVQRHLPASGVPSPGHLRRLRGGSPQLGADTLTRIPPG